jgi:hypothetical protein
MQAFVVGTALLCSCSAGNSGSVALGVQITKSNQPLISVDLTDGGASGVLPDGITIDRTRLLLNEVELHLSHMQVAGRVVRGPYILTLTGADLAAESTKTVADVTAPAATYADLELELEPLDTSEQTEPTPSSATAAELADFTAVGASAIIEGTSNGTPFKIIGKLTADRVTTAPVVVQDGVAVDVAITVDASTWFRDAAGNVIDPTVAANNDAIAMRVCLSLDPGDASKASACLGQSQGPGGRGGRPRHP